MLGGHRHKLCLTAALTALGLAGFGQSAAAAEPPSFNMMGVWTTGYLSGSTREAANGSYDITAMNMATGALSGTAETSGVHFALEGLESGSVAQIKLTEGSYTAYDTLHLSVLASGHVGGNGTFNSAGFSETGAGYWAEQNGASASEEAAMKAKEAEGEKRPTGTSIICNYEFATSENTCVASVGDGGAPPSVAPTGTVTFTTTSGAFSSGASCSITPTPSSPSVSSCSLVYFTTTSGLPSITVTYGGDARHAPSSGKTQFLGLGTEGTYESPTGPAGQYPNEVTIETEAPVAGTTVEGSAQGPDPHPIPVPIVLPGVSSSLDPTSAADLRIAEALATAVDVSGPQDTAKLTELDQSVERLDARAVELTKSPNAAEQAEAQKLVKDATALMESITRMDKIQGEYAKDALEGSRTAESAESSIEKLDGQAVELLKKPDPADQAKGQALLNEATQTLEALLKATKLKGETLKKVIGNASTAAAHRRLQRIRTRRVRALGHVTMRNVAAGKLKLKLRLNRAELNRLAGRRSSVTVYVHVSMILPSRLIPGGMPRSFALPVTIRRAPKHRR